MRAHNSAYLIFSGFGGILLPLFKLSLLQYRFMIAGSPVANSHLKGLTTTNDMQPSNSGLILSTVRLVPLAIPVLLAIFYDLTPTGLILAYIAVILYALGLPRIEYNRLSPAHSQSKTAITPLKDGGSSEDQTLKVFKDAIENPQVSLDQDKITENLFKALADALGNAVRLKLGFVNKVERVISDWHTPSTYDGLVSQPNGRINLDGDSPLAKALIAKQPVIQTNGGNEIRYFFPLVHRRTRLAVLEVATASAGPLTENKYKMIGHLCSDAAIALQNAQTFKSVRKTVQKLSSLYEVTGQIHSKRSPERIISLVADYAKRLPQSEKVVAWLTDSNSRIDSKSMLVRGCRRELPEKAWRADLVKLARMILKKKKPAIIRRYELPAHTVNTPAASIFVLGIPLMSKDRVKGVMIAMTTLPRRYAKDDIAALSILGTMAGRAIENASLYQRTKKLAAFEERYRIAMDLHDGLAQALFSISLNLEVCQRLIGQDPAEVKKRLTGLQNLTLETLKDTRKYILELQPDGVMADGLPNIIRSYVRKFNQSNYIKVRSSIRGKPASDMPISVKQNLYRILQEALANVIKHSKASEARVQLLFGDRQIELSVEDDGVGFPAAYLEDGKVSTGGMGLANMQKRAEMIGGHLVLESLPRQGTKVLVQLSNGDPYDN